MKTVSTSRRFALYAAVGALLAGAAIAATSAGVFSRAEPEDMSMPMDQEEGTMLNFLDFDDMGRAEGRQLGPEPGKGAVLHHSSGEADFDGLPGDQLLPLATVKRKLTEDATVPREKSVG